jgi:hypothetical protein
MWFWWEMHASQRMGGLCKRDRHLGQLSLLWQLAHEKTEVPMRHTDIALLEAMIQWFTSSFLVPPLKDAAPSLSGLQKPSLQHRNLWGKNSHHIQATVLTDSVPNPVHKNSAHYWLPNLIDLFSYVSQASLKLNSPASAFWVLKLQVCATMPWCLILFKIYITLSWSESCPLNPCHPWCILLLCFFSFLLETMTYRYTGLPILRFQYISNLNSLSCNCLSTFNVCFKCKCLSAFVLWNAGGNFLSWLKCVAVGIFSQITRHVCWLIRC